MTMQDQPLAQDFDFGLLKPECFVDSGDVMANLADAVARLVPQLALENLQLRRTLGDQSVRDALTGLFGRRYLEESLDREFVGARLYGDTVSVAILNVDHFQGFKARCGLPAGNILLQVIAQLVESQVRPRDIACRYGTEQFAFVMLGASTEAARRRAAELGQKIRTIGWCDNVQLTASVALSAGIASFPHHAGNPVSLLQAADLALRKAMGSERERVVVTSSAATLARA